MSDDYARNLSSLNELFPDMDKEVVDMVLRDNAGLIEPSVTILLGMNDPSYKPEEQISTQRNNLDSDFDSASDNDDEEGNRASKTPVLPVRSQVEDGMKAVRREPSDMFGLLDESNDLAATYVPLNPSKISAKKVNVGGAAGSSSSVVVPADTQQQHDEFQRQTQQQQHDEFQPQAQQQQRFYHNEPQLQLDDPWKQQSMFLQQQRPASPLALDLGIDLNNPFDTNPLPQSTNPFAPTPTPPLALAEDTNPFRARNPLNNISSSSNSTPPNV
ncbi:hypothetical protein LPJ66_001241 [Kickxella alabastrina]|uniref:Uncharacterized protein n=1 Tax=Kickxella alabastrina TaxID=61397 RepID=A0ACC1IU38_9FUNG|nr:hypothetical protein LPJ66_001241 [Kickxella alabastrina]